MARIGRIVVPGFPHHVTQRGNRRQQIFFEPSDYALYRDLLAERCRKASVEVWAYCLMPNHVHLVLMPHTSDGLARAIGEPSRRKDACADSQGAHRQRRNSQILASPRLTALAFRGILFMVRSREGAI